MENREKGKGWPTQFREIFFFPPPSPPPSHHPLFPRPFDSYLDGILKNPPTSLAHRDSRTVTFYVRETFKPRKWEVDNLPYIYIYIYSFSINASTKIDSFVPSWSFFSLESVDSLIRLLSFWNAINNSSPLRFIIVCVFTISQFLVRFFSSRIRQISFAKWKVWREGNTRNDAHCYRGIVWKRRTKGNQRIIIAPDEKGSSPIDTFFSM